VATQLNPLVVIVGETASGKTSLAIKIAKQFDGEIVCADSWTVRREVNIGTAKPTQAQRQSVPHHMLDVVGPCADFTAAVFKDMAMNAMNDIAKRGNLPLLVGGTGLYIDSILYDYTFLPEPPADLRQELNQLSIDELLNRCRVMNISTAAIDIRNKRRIIRAIETNGALPQKASLRSDILLIGKKITSIELEHNIAERVVQMVNEGLEHEVRSLSDVYGWGCEALKGIGYAEWCAYFEGRQSRQDTLEQIKKNTKALAKRQRTWFKRNKSIHWVTDENEAFSLTESFLNKYRNMS
jgi:tRNA dimethylallyltransferase